LCPWCWLAIACATTLLAYWPGLHGPLLLDDVPNLDPLLTWLHGDNSWQWALLGNHSGPLGRPLSMLSFMANFATTGENIFALKLTNLLLHLVCGMLLFGLLRRLLRHDAQLAAQADIAALAIAAVWLLHPLQVSTVVYVVQRMAQLSTLFVLLALLCYLQGREQLSGDRKRAGTLWLWLAFPAFVLLAALSKETGVLAPFLCLVLEVVYFSDGKRRPAAVKLFFATFAALPVIFAIAWLTHDPHWLLNGYQSRNFGLTERLLSETRVLTSYVHSILLPGGRNLGVYTDDYVVSTGWLTPWTTLPAVLLWCGIAATAAACWRRLPAFCAGVFLFLAGHLLESSVVPLELYFEHRNYLPMLGVLLAIAGLLQPVVTRSIASSPSMRFVFAAGFVGLLLILALATNARAWVWRYETVLTEQSLAAHPRSLRARMDHATQLLDSGKGAEAIPIMDAMIAGPDRQEQMMGGIYRIALDCYIAHDADPARLESLRALAPKHPYLLTSQALHTLAILVHDGRCGRLTDAALARLVQQYAHVLATEMPAEPDWRLHYEAADLFERAGILDQAERDAEMAATFPGSDPATGELWIRILISEHKYIKAQAVLSAISPRVPAYDLQGRAALHNLSQMIRTK
jgi:hypothetical protein